MDDVYNDEYEYTIRNFSVGYYNYNVVFTFKPDTDYAKLHPREAHKLFASVWNKYAGKYSLSYILCPEISKNGNYHVHAMLYFEAKDYDEHDKQLRLIRNYVNRKFGRAMFSRIENLTAFYKTRDIKTMLKREFYTSYKSIWNYNLKSVTMYAFWKPFFKIKY